MKQITMTLYIDPERLTSNPHYKYEPFLQALGRQVMYAATFGGPDRDTDMRGGVNSDETGIEICFTYRHAPNERGFTMAGISRKDGAEYSYHS